MTRYDLRPSLLEDTLQEFELVRFQCVEWGRLKKRHQHLFQVVGQRLPSDFASTRQVKWGSEKQRSTSHDDWFRVAKLGCRPSFNPR
jgi:hypothetical protein